MEQIKKLEYELEENDILYFLHIPKTGGTSLTNVLETPFSFKEIFPYVIFPDLFEKLPRNLGDFKLIRGHFGYWITKILPRNPIIITMLRKPIEHTLSLYAHQLRSFADGVVNVLDTGNETLEDIFADPGKSRIFTNHQTRHLNLDFDIIEVIRSLREKGENGKAIRQLYKPKVPTYSEDVLLETAKGRLSKFAFFGLTERFEDSLFLLYYTFGWFPAATAPKLNISSHKKKIDELPKETADKLIQATKLDEQLYEFGERIFEKRYQEMINELKSKYFQPIHEKMSFSEMMYDMLEMHFFHRDKNFDLRPKNTINYGFGQRMIGAGWQQREKYDEDTIFRWSGPESRSDIYFPLTNDTDLKIRISIALQMSKEILQSLKMEVNGKPVTLNCKTNFLNFVRNKKIEFNGIIPASHLTTNKKLTKISFIVDKTISAKDLDSNSTDERKLGLAFSRIKIEPN